MNGQDNPLALRVVAGLHVFLGVCAVIEVVVSLLHSHINLNFGVLGLWIGPGLLRHDRVWRNWALAFLGIAFVGLPLFCALAVRHAALNFKLFGVPMGQVPTGIAFAVVIPVLMISAWEYHVLIRPDIRALFERGPASSVAPYR